MNLSDGFVTYYIANIFFNIVFGYFYAYFLSSTRPAVSVIRYTLVLSFIVEMCIRDRFCSLLMVNANVFEAPL